MGNWNNLNNPPIAVALFQLKYHIRDRKLSDFLSHDAQLKHHLPIRMDSIRVGIDLGGSSIPLGMSQITGTTEAKIGMYVYLSIDQKSKLEISEDTITFIDEHPYQGWEHFKETTKSYLSIISDVLNNCKISRTSIRFINRFTFDNFDNPQEYFKTLISCSENKQLPYPLRQSGFRLFMDIPDTDIYSNVNQNVENTRTNTYIYTFDIDVLDKQVLVFNINTLSDNMERLRNIKNEIFFSNVTQKTLDLCN
jgi:uncharacterized protein (TIGR04255 family)